MKFSYKTKHTLTLQYSNYASWYLFQRIENACPHKKLHLGAFNSFIHNYQN